MSYKKLPPPGSDPRTIAAYINEEVWGRYQRLRTPWLKQMEQNIRFLAGQQYDVWFDQANQFIDVSTYFLPDDERWRKAPVFNWAKEVWFVQALAKLTENIPVLGALPATADARDAASAAIFDPFFRYEWAQMGMPELMFKHYGWLLTAGESVLMLRWDPNRGLPEEFKGPLDLDLGTDRPLTDAPYVMQPDGTIGPPYQFGEDGQPQLSEDGSPLLDLDQRPYVQPQGDFAADILCPATVLRPYGPEPYYQAPWIVREYFLSCEEIEDRYGVEVTPDGGNPQAQNPGLDPLIAYNYTSPYLNPGSWGSWNGFFGDVQAVATGNMVRVRERWGREKPYGRLTIVTVSTGQVLYDDINPYVIPGEREEVIIPFYWFRKPDLPFRQEGSSALESIDPIARAENRRLGAMMDFADHNEQPLRIVNRNFVQEDQYDQFNLPGGIVGTDGDVNTSVRIVDPPRLPDAGGLVADRLRAWMELLGNVGVGSGGPVTEGASGELQREVRFDADRPWGATLRLNSWDWSRIGKDLMAMAAVCLTDNRLLSIAGEDQAVQFLEVRPDLFLGRININPLPESYIMETRADKQARVKELMAMGLPPEVGFKVLGYPDVNRALRPGGEAYPLAQRLVAQMVTTGQMAPVLPEHDHPTFIQVAKSYQQTLDYLTKPPELQQLVRTFIQLHEMLGAQETIRQGQIAAGVQGHLALDAAESQAPAQQVVQQVQEPMITGAPQRGPETALPQ